MSSLVTFLTQLPAPAASALAPNAARQYTFTYKASATTLGDVVFKPGATATYPVPNSTPVFSSTPGVTSGLVRAERTGLDTGRIYRLLYSGADQAGNATSCMVELTVPHDQR